MDIPTERMGLEEDTRRFFSIKIYKIGLAGKKRAPFGTLLS